MLFNAGMMSFEQLTRVGMDYFRFRDRKLSTNRTLNSEQLHVIRFLTIYGKEDELFLPSEQTLIAYVVYASFALAAVSIPKYMGAWKKLHSDNPERCRGVSFEAHTAGMAHLDRVYKGIALSFGVTRTNVQEAFPTALLVLLVDRARRENTPEGDQFVAFLLLCVFAVRRLADVMARIDSEFESIRHVCVSDFWMGAPHMIVRIKATKTRGLLEEPLMFPIARLPGNILCPVAAMERHMARLFRGRRQALASDPIFQVIKNGDFTGRALGKDNASAEIRRRVAAVLGRAAPQFSGRSCRVTGATMMIKAGVSEILVQWIGDWKESAHWGRYIRTPLPELLNITRRAGDALKLAK